MKKLKIAISGSSGFVGSALSIYLTKNGHEVLPLVRRKTGRPNEILFNPRIQSVEKEKLEGIDVVINLSGKNISSGRWTEGVKQELWTSRVDTTAFLVKTLASLKNPPKTFLCASGIGNSGFLGELREAWEQEASKFSGRWCALRFGVILSKQGGFLRQLRFLFKLGLGGRLGSGAQLMSWIALPDVLTNIERIAMDGKTHGPITFTAPHPISNREFTATLAKSLHRKAFLHLPAFVIKLFFGQMGEELMLASNSVQPDAQMVFEFPNLDKILVAESRPIV